MLSRTEQLAFCSICIHREPGKHGMVCGLTKKFADFEETCPDYELDTNENEKQLLRKLKAAGYDAGNDLHAKQNIQNGLLIAVFGLLASVITVTFADEIGFTVFPGSLVFFGLRMYYRGKEQEEAFNEYLEKKDSHLQK